MKTKSLSIFLVALFVVEMNLGAEEDNNENKEGEKFKYEKIGDEYANEADFSLKTLLIGNSKVGKSALMKKICKNEFLEKYEKTTVLKFVPLYFNIVSDMGKTVLKYEICDFCGAEAYRAMFASFYQNAQVCLLAYDVTNEKSFNDIAGWVNDVKSNNTDKSIHFVLIGTKIDLKGKRVVSKKTGKKFAGEKGMKFVEVSAKTGDGIKKLENILAKIIYKEYKKDKGEKIMEDESSEESDEKNEEKNEEKNNKKNNKKNGFVNKKKSTSTLCDCCKKICENC